ncbi:GtrA family protein [Microtetraspora fusca]|uniref:GtrA family protein n=1 Tax=Microtetraspora fusca TaxID=1997 RepID=A0ABW6V4U0_MICFU|nr:GtrA family protein [Microtetraspora fusca]
MLELKSRSARENPDARRIAIPAVLGQRITYLLAGAMTAGVYYVLLGLGLLVAKNSVPYLFLVVVSHFVTTMLVYPAYRLVVFKTSGVGWLPGYLRFYAVGLSFLGMSVIGLPILVEFAGIPIMVAQGLIILLSPPLSYAIHRAWTFREGDGVRNV